MGKSKNAVASVGRPAVFGNCRDEPQTLLRLLASRFRLSLAGLLHDLRATGVCVVHFIMQTFWIGDRLDYHRFGNHFGMIVFIVWPHFRHLRYCFFRGPTSDTVRTTVQTSPHFMQRGRIGNCHQ